MYGLKILYIKYIIMSLHRGETTLGIVFQNVLWQLEPMPIKPLKTPPNAGVVVVLKAFRDLCRNEPKRKI